MNICWSTGCIYNELPWGTCFVMVGWIIVIIIRFTFWLLLPFEHLFIDLVYDISRKAFSKVNHETWIKGFLLLKFFEATKELHVWILFNVQDNLFVCKFLVLLDNHSCQCSSSWLSTTSFIGLFQTLRINFLHKVPRYKACLDHPSIFRI